MKFNPVALLLIVSILGLLFGNVFYINRAEASFYFLKEFIIKPLVRQLANALENKLVNKINGLVSGLQQKTPSYILNWRNYTLDSQGKGNDIFRAILADAKLCPYFKDKATEAFGASGYGGLFAGSEVKAGKLLSYQNKTSIPGLPSFQNITNCSLPAGLNIPNFQNDFTKGGWAAWNQLIKPENNFYGVYALALQEKDKQIQTEKETARDYSIAGQGFFGQKLSTGGGAGPGGCTGKLINTANNVSGALNFTGGDTGSRCLWYGKEVSPPQFLNKLSLKSLDTKIGRVGFGTELTDVLLSLIGAVVNGLTSRILNFIDQASYSQPPPYQPEPTPIPTINSFDTGDVPATDPNFNTETCLADCESDRDRCNLNPPEVCTTDPVTNEQTCQEDQTACASQENQCRASCP